jgi:hypothetical protein
MSKEVKLFENHPGKYQNIWRYTTLAKLLNMIQDAELMELISLKTSIFEDKYEGTLSQMAQQRLRDLILQYHYMRFDKEFGSARRAYPKRAEQGLREEVVKVAPDRGAKVDQMVNKLRQLHFANCWTTREYEDSNMWRAYTTESDGVVIKTDFKSIKSSFKDCDGVIYMGNVKYIDFSEEDMEMSTISPFFYKNIQFKSESEFRIIVTDHEDEYFDPKGGVEEMPSEPKENIRPIKMNTHKLIEEIRIHPKADDYLISVINDIFSEKKKKHRRKSHSFIIAIKSVLICLCYPVRGFIRLSKMKKPSWCTHSQYLYRLHPSISAVNDSKHANSSKNVAREAPLWEPKYLSNTSSLNL